MAPPSTDLLSSQAGFGGLGNHVHLKVFRKYSIFFTPVSSVSSASSASSASPVSFVMFTELTKLTEPKELNELTDSAELAKPTDVAELTELIKLARLTKLKEHIYVSLVMFENNELCGHSTHAQPSGVMPDRKP